MHRQFHAKRQNRARAAGQIADARLPSIHLPPAPTAPNLTLTPTDARRDAQERCHGRPCYACAKSALTPPVGFARRPPFRADAIECTPAPWPTRWNETRPTSAMDRLPWSPHGLPYYSLARHLRSRSIKDTRGHASNPARAPLEPSDTALHPPSQWRSSNRCSPPSPSFSLPQLMLASVPRPTSPYPTRTSLPMASLVLPL